MIPFNTTATVELPDANINNVLVNGTRLESAGISAGQSGKQVQVEINSGTWEFIYIPEVDYLKYYSTQMALSELQSNAEAKKVLGELVPQVTAFPQEMLGKVGHQSLRELSHMPFLPISLEVLEELDIKLKKIKVIVE